MFSFALSLESSFCSFFGRLFGGTTMRLTESSVFYERLNDHKKEGKRRTSLPFHHDLLGFLIIVNDIITMCCPCLCAVYLDLQSFIEICVNDVVGIVWEKQNKTIKITKEKCYIISFLPSLLPILVS